MAKSKWENVKDKLDLIECWARDGLTDKQIAKNLNISEDTFYEYKKKYSEFSDTLKKGKEVIDYEVENALLKRALGYEYEEKTYETQYNERTGKSIERLTKRITKQVAPDTTAQIFWLKNRRADKWRDKQQIEHSGEINNPFKDLSTEELRQLIKDE